MSEDKAPASTRIGGKLRSALTDDQIETLLDVLAETAQLRAVEEQLRAADPDLAETVRRILEAPRIPAEAAPSLQKTAEIWNDIWEKWADHVADVADEQGPYANHEEHWHPPYLDYGALADDLEEAAERLSEWIDRAHALVGEPDLFLESLAEINDNMKSLPEWFQPVEDDFVLGPQASSCVLRWTWLGLAGQAEPGRKLVDSLCDLELPGQHTELDRDTCCQFFSGLPEGVCREVHAYLREPQFAERLAELRSIWHRIQHEFEGRFDPAEYLQACEDHLEEDWRYGQPLIAEALARQDFEAAERFVELTFSSLLRWAGEEPWRTEKLLVPESRYYTSEEEEQARRKLLEQWEDVAVRRGNLGRAAVLRLQRAVLTSPEDWAVVLEAFEECRRRPGTSAVVEQLFAEWRQRIADVCLPPEPGRKPPTDTWAHRLIDAQRNVSLGRKPFLESMEVWLECCREHVAFFQKNWRSLARLTRNLPRHNETALKCPTFYSHVLVPASHLSGDMERSLRHALASVDEAADGISVLPAWEQHLHTLVPLPGSSGSYYRESALWMKSLSEVNPATYASLLAQWKTEFRRRRNLWADMASAGCPSWGAAL